MTRFYVYEYHRAKASKYGDVGSPYYVGKGQRSRRFDKTHNVKPPKLATCNVIVKKGLTEQEAFAEEIRLIALYGRIDLGTGCLRNRTNGGDGCSNPSQETRERRRQANLGKTHSSKTKEKLRLIRTGTTMSFESSEKKRRFNLDTKHWVNKKHSSESIEKMRQAKLGKTASQSTKDKMSASHTGVTIAPAAVEKSKLARTGVTRSSEACKRIRLGRWSNQEAV